MLSLNSLRFSLGGGPVGVGNPEPRERFGGRGLERRVVVRRGGGDDRFDGPGGGGRDPPRQPTPRFLERGPG